MLAYAQLREMSSPQPPVRPKFKLQLSICTLKTLELDFVIWQIPQADLEGFEDNTHFVADQIRVRDLLEMYQVPGRSMKWTTLVTSSRKRNFKKGYKSLHIFSEKINHDTAVN